ncbi:MAG: Stk1 family PASTA domain-containing Ser/Thr kinase [Dethiobacteria bacterium]|jgi:beta-lactam-binding protein with PASTA domain/tRNA A-37 threonylcarbamoyl transferase component Bud32|nr:Stk1 family PASTA domain-containing Ser/Thr kinase [Bacillota bacterium]
MLIGKLLDGRYKVLAKIGQGGMAKVYKGLDTLLNRYVSIKVLREQLTEDQEFVRRFRREAQAAASLSHPHIVNIYDVGQESDIYYIVMEYIDGQTLKSYLSERGRLPVSEAVEITRQICEALVHAHQHNVIHRDIKPPNILITRNGCVKVTDFGIARAASSATVTYGNSILGTVHYFSPEQARGSHVGEQSDIYSLGIVLYEMLTGRVPFSGESPISIALKHLQDDIISPSQIVDLPEPVERIVMKAVQKSPEERYSNAKELLEDLVSWQNEGVVRAVVNSSGSSDEIPTMEMRPVRGGKEKIKRKKGKPAWNKIVILVLIFIVFIGLLTAAVHAFRDFMDVPEVEVPLVEGKSLKEAEIALAEAELEYEIVSEVYDEQVPAGHVVSQNPEGGKTVRQGRVVELTLSIGPELIPVPDLVNRPRLEASLILEDAGFEYVFHEEYSDTVPAGFVIRQDPGKDFKLIKGETIEVFISKGSEPFRINNFVGKNLDDVREWLKLYNLEVRYIDREYSQEYPEGVVIDQYPQPNEMVQAGDPVDLTVSDGPDPALIEEERPDDDEDDEEVDIDFENEREEFHFDLE